MTLTFQLYSAARDCLTSLMERLTPRELYYIGGPDPLPAPLTPEEEQVMEQLKTAFRRSEKLQRHVDFLFSHGGLYTCCNRNLLFHGCIPMNEDGSLMDM